MHGILAQGIFERTDLASYVPGKGGGRRARSVQDTFMALAALQTAWSCQTLRAAPVAYGVRKGCQQSRTMKEVGFQDCLLSACPHESLRVGCPIQTCSTCQRKITGARARVGFRATGTAPNLLM
eukprot:363267-Chlamydomonas_euryale.AAC.3